MQEKRHGTARFVLNKEGQLEHLIQIGGYTLHVIVQQQLSFEQLDYVVRQYKHHGKIPLKGVETIEVPLSHSIE